MLRVLAKPFTGLQMTQLGGELQGLFAPRSNLHFYPKASVQPVLLPVPTYCLYHRIPCTTVLPVLLPEQSRPGCLTRLCA